MATTGGRGVGQSYGALSRAMSPRLPTSAASRLERFSTSTSHTSLLSVSSAYGLEAVGFDAVGDVMGCIASQISHVYIGGCGPSSALKNPRTVLLGASSGTRVSYVQRVNGAYRTSLERLRAEAEALGADGVVDIRLTREVHEDLHEVVAVGTAVRARSRTRPSTVFTTVLPGADVAKLLLSGWVPVTLHVAAQVGIRHDDYRTLTQAGRMNRSNVEVDGYTELMQRVRTAAGSTLRTALSGAGADGGLLSDLHTSHWHTHCQRSGSDHVALAVATGTSVARFGHRKHHTSAPPAMLPVTPSGRGR